MEVKVTAKEVSEAFQKLRSVGYISFSKLPSNKTFIITNMYRNNTKRGSVVVAELEDYKLYLPDRFNALEDKIIEEVADGGYVLIKKLDERSQYELFVEKAIVEDDNDEDDDEDTQFFIPNAQPLFGWEKAKRQRF